MAETAENTKDRVMPSPKLARADKVTVHIHT